jgi:hypothetical protein
MSGSKGLDGGHRPTGTSKAQHVMFLHDPAKVQQNANPSPASLRCLASRGHQQCVSWRAARVCELSQ